MALTLHSCFEEMTAEENDRGQLVFDMTAQGCGKREWQFLYKLNSWEQLFTLSVSTCGLRQR